MGTDEHGFYIHEFRELTRSESGRGLPQSKTMARPCSGLANAERPGVRWQSEAATPLSGGHKILKRKKRRLSWPSEKLSREGRDGKISVTVLI